MSKDSEIKYRKSNIEDLKDIVSLLINDELGKEREVYSGELDVRYIKAFHKIDIDNNQYLMVAELNNKIIGTCHITIMPSMTFKGSTRAQIEAVRIHSDFRGKKVGEKMIKNAINFGKERGVSIFQLNTNKQRMKAIKFYEKLGFVSTHEGMKLNIEK